MGAPFLMDLVNELDNSAHSLELAYEIILVNDASPDNSWEIIKKLSIDKPNLKAINIETNVGQHMAIFEGLKVAKGKHTMVLDCDLQDNPKETGYLWSHRKPNQYVLAVRKNRKSSWIDQLSSFLFYQFLYLIKGVKINSKTVNFGIYNQNLIQAILNDVANYKYFPLAVARHGAEKIEVEIEHQERTSGRSNYSLMDRIRLALFILGKKTKQKNVIIKDSIHV